MKVTLSNTITCKLIFRVEGVDPIDERNKGKAYYRHHGLHGLICEMEEKGIREGK